VVFGLYLNYSLVPFESFIEEVDFKHGPFVVDSEDFDFRNLVNLNQRVLNQGSFIRDFIPLPAFATLA
jgi:hypothetical protein